MFLARIWNKTITVGSAVTKKELSSVLSDIFDGGRPCVGIPQEVEELPQIEHNSQSSIYVKASKSCHLLLGKDADPDAVSCIECLKLSWPVETQTPDVKCKVEIKETGDAESFLDQKETDVSFKSKDHGIDDADYDGTEDFGTQEEESEWEEDREEIEKEPRNKSDKRSCKFDKKLKSKTAKLNCPYCDFTTLSHNKLVEHKRKVHLWGEFRCLHCDFRYVNTICQ